LIWRTTHVRQIPGRICKISNILAVTGACIMENTLKTTGFFVIVWQASTEYYQKLLTDFY